MKNNTALLITPVLIAAFMFTLDETISNVALTYIAGSMSVSLNESTWIVTSYLVSSCIAIPSVSFMCKLMGRKSYFITSLIVFIGASFMCAISKSMVMIVLSRFLQGLGGGSLLPLGQSITMEAFKPEERSKAMALFGFVVIFGPIVGPIVGGWLTENYSWPWIYLINIPIGIVTIILAQYNLKDPPYAKKQKNPNVDTLGIVFLSLWIIFLQIVLDKGNDADWFNATWICCFFTISVIFGIAFFTSQLTRKNTLVDLSVFKDKNYNIGSWSQVILMAVF
ncbi:MAG: DHA2 family efflux MFS transporter permease subunit, partial [Candidatus Gastranaerophilaceae bacterium]